MPLSFDDTNLLAGLTEMVTRINHGADRGLADAASLIQSTDQETDAYRGMSGATRASTIAAVLDTEYASKASAAYGIAVALLDGYSGHEGKAYRAESGVVLVEGEKGVMLTNFTEYAVALEVDQAGLKAHIGPTIEQTAITSLHLIADAIKQGLGV